MVYVPNPNFQMPHDASGYPVPYLSSSDGATPTLPYVDPVSHRMLVSATITGSFGGTSSTDQAAFTAGTSVGTPMMGEYNTVNQTLTSGTMGIVSLTAARSQWVTMMDSGGTDMSDTTNHALKVNVAAGTVTAAQAIAANLNAQVVGNVASGATDAGNPVKAGGVFNTTQPTVTTGQRVDVQSTARGAVIVATGVDTLNTTINTALPTGANTIGAVTQAAGPWTINFTQLAGVAVASGNGVSGTGNLRVNLASDNAAIANWGQGATGAAVPTGAQYKGGIAKTALPAAATDGNLTGAMMDKFGRQVVIPQSIRDLESDATVTITTTTETTVLAAVATVFLDVTSVMVANTSATGVRVDFRDATAGTVRFSIWVPATDTRGIVFQVPKTQAAVNNNWTAQASAAVTDLRIFMQAVQNK